MNALSIVSLIQALASMGISITNDVINLLHHTTNAVNAVPGSPEHTASVDAVNTLAGVAK